MFQFKAFQGLKESVITRKTVQFFLESEVAQVFRKWCENIIFPEEIFFQTLCRIDQEIYYETEKIVHRKAIGEKEIGAPLQGSLSQILVKVCQRLCGTCITV